MWFGPSLNVTLNKRRYSYKYIISSCLLFMWKEHMMWVLGTSFYSFFFAQYAWLGNWNLVSYLLVYWIQCKLDSDVFTYYSGKLSVKRAWSHCIFLFISCLCYILCSMFAVKLMKTLNDRRKPWLTKPKKAMHTCGWKWNMAVLSIPTRTRRNGT